MRKAALVPLLLVLPALLWLGVLPARSGGS
jgi:hypothetical protein